ncbi:unnamed protein product [Trichogramma brassicae]|uniref:DNA-directed DNA polymerase n=1 Tax=Trichogramma brassicae TaxID=86971 RepID=A0A6H5IZ69_9HYME|nr:unnamed protein product [Trichogramma brassicae]
MKHDYSEVIEELRRALRSGECIDEAVINEGIRYLENALSSILSRSKKHKYQSQLSHLLSIRARYEKRGSGLSDDEVRIKIMMMHKSIFSQKRSVSIRVHLIARKLQETALPPPEQFYSSLTDSDISTKDYDDAKQVWDSFKISNLGEYSDLYLKTDVLLLVEVFENFRKTCHEAYELDPAHYYTLPGYSWDAMLLYTQVELELLTDVDMLLFVEKGIRGGVSQCCSRFSEANNRYMGEDYNPEKEDVYLMYYDVNNLYGWAMAQYLPYGGFEWDDAKDYLTLPEDSEYGYILEVDLEYPESLHDSHKDLPLCPEHACPPGSKQRKLLTTLKAKHKYVIHYRSLQQAVRLGIQSQKSIEH